MLLYIQIAEVVRIVYVFDAKFDRYKATKIYKLIKAGAIAEQSATRIVDQLRIKGLSYRRINMLHDVRRARAVEFAKTSDTRYRSGMFFDYVYEPFRKDTGLRTTEVNKILRDRERAIYEDEEELLLIDDIEDRYLKIVDLL